MGHLVDMWAVEVEGYRAGHLGFWYVDLKRSKSLGILQLVCVLDFARLLGV